MFQKMMMKRAAKGVLNTYSACLERALEEHKSQHGSDPQTKAEAIACAYQAQEWATQVYAGMRNPKMSEFWRNYLSEHTGNVVADIQAGNLPEGGAEPTREAKAKPVDPSPELSANDLYVYGLYGELTGPPPKRTVPAKHLADRTHQAEAGGENSQPPTEIKLCPYCAEEIKFAAIKCKHCHEFLTEKPNEDTDDE